MIGRALVEDEGGWTLLELLVSMVIMLVVLGAVLLTFQVFDTVNRQSFIRQDTDDQARTAVDRLTRDLRAVTSVGTSTPTGIERANPTDLVAYVSDPARTNSAEIRRMRFCLDGGSGGRQTLWMQTETWSSALPAQFSSTCPDPAWPQKALAGNITNLVGNRTLFTYYVSGTSANNIHVDLYVDANTSSNPGLAHAPLETHISSGIYLRDQVSPPTAQFSATPEAGNRILLDGTSSSDPAGQQLTYAWSDNGTAIGSGQTFTYAATAGAHPLSLTVTDASGRVGTSAVQTVTAAP